MLYRAIDGQLQDVTIDSGTSEFRYSIGLTSGDWNQDGFPDLVIANIGRNALLVNNGDGSFTTLATDPLEDPTVMSTSVAMADVTGDALPDIINLSYLHDSTLAKKPLVNRKGEIEAVPPGDFELGMARVLVNDQGKRGVMPISSSDGAKERGLGIVISDFDGTAGNEIFIGNDQLPDQLWKLAESTDKHARWINVTPLVGCALGNGGTTVCTHIGNELFASFSTTDSKSRLNFLRLLCQGHDEQYRWCEESLESLRAFGVNKKLLAKMSCKSDGVWPNRAAWEQQLKNWRVSPKHRTRVSEAALCGKLLTEAWYSRIGLVSDDAPQFKLFGLIHGLCWVHGERKIDRLIPLTAPHRRAKEQSQQQFWDLYASLKDYRESATEQQRIEIGLRFDAMCSQKTGYVELNEALGLLGAKREEFLAVLDHPQLPLHNNLSENDIREYARLRKISGGTRSDMGRRCRDTFMSLKKTCRKLGVSFGSYLRDQLSQANQIPPLVELIRSKAIDGSPESIASTA